MGPISEVIEKRELHENEERSLTLIGWTDGWAIFVVDRRYPCWGNVLTLDWYTIEKQFEKGRFVI